MGYIYVRLSSASLSTLMQTQALALISCKYYQELPDQIADQSSQKVPKAESDVLCHAPQYGDSGAQQSADASSKCAAAAVKI